MFYNLPLVNHSISGRDARWTWSIHSSRD